jgi:ABC-2 type transport system ATP-binding protein
MTNNAVSIHGLSKRFGERAAVDRLDLEIPAGVVAGFVGPNGAGKTTTLRMLLGLIRPTTGTGSVLGRPFDDPSGYLSAVGALIEGPAFYPGLSGRRNLTVLATIGGHDRAEIPVLLDQVGLADRGDDPYRTYSLGMKQRLGIAAALLGDPRLLILDEPTNGLDPSGIAEMRELLVSLGRGERTVIVSSHVLAELEQVCDWLVVIDHGQLVFTGPARDLLDSAATNIVVEPEHADDLARLAATLAGAGHTPERHNGATLLVGSPGGDARQLAADISRLAAGEGIALVELHARGHRLEERYLDLVTGGDR